MSPSGHTPLAFRGTSPLYFGHSVHVDTNVVRGMMDVSRRLIGAGVEDAILHGVEITVYSPTRARASVQKVRECTQVLVKCRPSTPDVHVGVET